MSANHPVRSTHHSSSLGTASKLTSFSLHFHIQLKATTSPTDWKHRDFLNAKSRDGPDHNNNNLISFMFDIREVFEVVISDQLCVGS